MGNPWPASKPFIHGLGPPVSAGVRRGAAVNVLPAGSQPTWWIDNTDLDTLFLDVARTMPVTSNGEIVEAVTDKGPNGWHLDQIATGGVGKPTYQAAATGGLGALAFDRTANGSLGQMIRTSNAAITISYTECIVLTVANWVDPVVVGEALLVHGVEDRVGNVLAGNDIAAQAAEGGASQFWTGQAGPIDFACWVHQFSPVSGRCSVSGVVGVADDLAAGAMGEWVDPPSGRIGMGGNQSGAAGSSGWHGSISEHVVWAEAGDIPTEAAVETYVLGKYGITFL